MNRINGKKESPMQPREREKETITTTTSLQKALTIPTTTTAPPPPILASAPASILLATEVKTNEEKAPLKLRQRAQGYKFSREQNPCTETRKFLFGKSSHRLGLALGGTG